MSKALAGVALLVGVVPCTEVCHINVSLSPSLHSTVSEKGKEYPWVRINKTNKQTKLQG